MRCFIKTGFSLVFYLIISTVRLWQSYWNQSTASTLRLGFHEIKVLKRLSLWGWGYHTQIKVLKALSGWGFHTIIKVLRALLSFNVGNLWIYVRHLLCINFILWKVRNLFIGICDISTAWISFYGQCEISTDLFWNLESWSFEL